MKTKPMQKPTITELSLSPAMIEEVWRDFERDHPGLTYRAQTKEDFTERLMAKITASARTVEGGNA